MNFPTPIGLLQDKGVISEILCQLPRTVLDEAEIQSDPWTWLARWIQKNPVEHWNAGTVGRCNGKCAMLEKAGFKSADSGSFRKTFVAAASQRKAFNVLAQVARDGGSISSHDWHLKIQAAQKQGNRKLEKHLTKKHIKSILQTVRGRRWLLENKEKDLSASPKMREWARREYEKFYAADVRRLGRTKADKKWKSTKTPRLQLLGANDDRLIAAAMTREWLVVGNNGFPGLCFMSDEVLATLLGHGLPVPALHQKAAGWKTIRTIRERIGLKKGKILFTRIEKVGDKKWAILNQRGQKTHSVTLLPNKPLPPEL